MDDYGHISTLISRYAHAFDHHDLDALVGCFTETATFTWDIEGGATGGPYAGRAAIHETNRLSLEGQSGPPRHVMSNVQLSQEGDRTIALWYMTLFALDGGQVAPLTTGEYRAEVVRDSGRWLFSLMHLHCDLPF